MPTFRHWVYQKWLEHQTELESYNLPVNYGAKDYFRKYKYWLKREYTYQKKKHD